MEITPEALHFCLKTDYEEYGLPYKVAPFPGMTVQDAFAISLSESLTKKLISNVKPDANARALDKFLSVNERCGTWSLPELHSWTETLINLVRQEIWNFWHVGGYPLIDHPYQLLEKGRVGPGANIGARGGSAYAKLFSSPLTCTSQSLYFWYRRYADKFPTWASAEKNREATYGGPLITESSRLSFVPKNDEISRCICIEPTLNTFFQLGFAHALEGRLRERFGISLQEQPFRNRDLARLGSITNELSTIDLSSASDSMSLGMLRYLLPSDFYHLLCKYRCPSIDVKGRGTVQLNMISTMGNGYTFPLQTMLFCCTVVACMKFAGLKTDKRDSISSWGVFGDDIICPREVTRHVLLVLDILGFQINHDKTFVEGPFRESCGSDFFTGVDVRGVYIKSVSTLQDRYVAINQLIRFSTKSGIPLERTIRLLLDTVDRRVRVPPYEDLSSGLHVPYSLSGKRRSRYSERHL
jgi:hypothetical protein